MAEKGSIVGGCMGSDLGSNSFVVVVVGNRYGVELGIQWLALMRRSSKKILLEERWTDRERRPELP